MNLDEWASQLRKMAGPPKIGTYWHIVVTCSSWPINLHRPQQDQTLVDTCTYHLTAMSDTAAEALSSIVERPGFWEQDSWQDEGMHGPILVVPKCVVTEADVAAWHEKYGERSEDK